MNIPFLNVMREHIRHRVALQRRSLPELIECLPSSRTPHPFVEQLYAKPAPRFIAEVKFASPSLGQLAMGDPVQIAGQYLEYGAAAISVLTEPNFFQGSIAYLEQIRQAFPEALLLMKDFILDESQLFQARVCGADAVLLIVAFLEEHTLHILYHQALALGLTPLIEVHTKEELHTAQSMGATLIGVNHRNLHTLEVDLSVSQSLSERFDSASMYIAESGIQSAEDIQTLQTYGFGGFLIGSALMQQREPGQALKALRESL